METKISDLSYEHQELIEAMKSQLLIALVNRLGGEVVMPAIEIDGTGKYNFAFKLDPTTRNFTFQVIEKSTGEVVRGGNALAISWKEIQEQRDAAWGTLKLIARGNPKSGRGLAGETVLNLARDVLIKAGVKW